MTLNGYEVFNYLINNMNVNQIEEFKLKINETFAQNCKNKEISFSIQNFIKHSCLPVKL